MPTSLINLAEDVIRVVLTHLNPIDLTRLSCVCKHFRNLINDKQVWKQVIFRQLDDAGAPRVAAGYNFDTITLADVKLVASLPHMMVKGSPGPSVPSSTTPRFSLNLLYKAGTPKPNPAWPDASSPVREVTFLEGGRFLVALDYILYPRQGMVGDIWDLGAKPLRGENESSIATIGTLSAPALASDEVDILWTGVEFIRKSSTCAKVAILLLERPVDASCDTATFVLHELRVHPTSTDATHPEKFEESKRLKVPKPPTASRFSVPFSFSGGDYLAIAHETKQGFIYIVWDLERDLVQSWTSTHTVPFQRFPWIRFEQKYLFAGVDQESSIQGWSLLDDWDSAGDGINIQHREPTFLYTLPNPVHRPCAESFVWKRNQHTFGGRTLLGVHVDGRSVLVERTTFDVYALEFDKDHTPSFSKIARFESQGLAYGSLFGWDIFEDSLVIWTTRRRQAGRVFHLRVHDLGTYPATSAPKPEAQIDFDMPALPKDMLETETTSGGCLRTGKFVYISQWTWSPVLLQYKPNV